MHTLHTFSLRAAFRKGWELLRSNTGFFVVLSLITALLQYSQRRHTAIIIVQVIAILIWSILWKKISLAAATGKQRTFAFGDVQKYFPTFIEILSVIALSICTGFVAGIGVLIMVASIMAYIFVGSIAAMVIIGAVILLVGLYIQFRLFLSVYVYLDQKKSITASLGTSWQLTKGGRIWKIAWSVLIISFANAIGSAVLRGLGLLIVQTPSSYAMAELYTSTAGVAPVAPDESVAVQPAEILPPTEDSPSETNA